MTTTTMTPPSPAVLIEALRLVELGYRVLPARPGAKAPACRRGVHDATDDLRQIRRWWRDMPGANLALATAGLIAIDIDHDGPCWIDELVPDDAPRAITPRGRHVLFRQPPGAAMRSTVGRLGESIDTRADAGYIIVAPSVVSGRAYRWDVPLDRPAADLPELPASIAARLRVGAGT